jgi:hypothetical protein
MLVAFVVDPAALENNPAMTGLAALGQQEVRSSAAKALINAGDPFVLPTLRGWLAEWVKAGGEPSFAGGDLSTALYGLAQARDAASVAPMEELFRAPGFKTSYLRDSLLEAITAIGAARSKPILAEALNDERIRDSRRSELAAALVRLHEPAGRAWLLKHYAIYLEHIGTPQQSHAETYAALSFLDDPELIATLRARHEAAPPGIPKNNLQTLLNLMNVSALSDDQLKDLLARGAPVEINQRYHAGQVIARRGGADLLPFLESLRSAPPDPAYGRFAEMRSGLVDTALRQIRFREGAKPSTTR